jgi:hypothetical protein
MAAAVTAPSILACSTRFDQRTSVAALPITPARPAKQLRKQKPLH